MINLDQIDNKILRALSNDGRISNLHLAEKVGLSPSACLRRVQDLEKKQIIKGYRAVIDNSKLGKDITAFITVGLNSHQKQDQENFERIIKEAKDVTECHNITG